MRDLSEIVKAYDIRGVVDEQLDTDAVAEIGVNTVNVLEGFGNAT